MNEKRPEDIVTELLENHDEAYIKKICRNLLRRGFGPEGDRKWQHVSIIRELGNSRYSLSVFSQEFDFKFSISSHSGHSTEFYDCFGTALGFLEDAGWEMFQNIEDIDNGRTVAGMKRRVHKLEAGHCTGMDKVFDLWKDFPGSVSTT